MITSDIFLSFLIFTYLELFPYLFNPTCRYIKIRYICNCSTAQHSLKSVGLWVRNMYDLWSSNWQIYWIGYVSISLSIQKWFNIFCTIHQCSTSPSTIVLHVQIYVVHSMPPDVFLTLPTAPYASPPLYLLAYVSVYLSMSSWPHP